VSAKGEEIKWQQISEDLVPVNITCLQDGPEYIFHITAYNSQVEKIMDIRLVQPGILVYKCTVNFYYTLKPIHAEHFKKSLICLLLKAVC